MVAPLKKINITINTEVSLAIIRYFKDTKHWTPDKVIDEALRLLFDEK